jgi:transposase
MDSLAMLVTETLRHDPFCGDLFVFRSKRSDRVKILAWDGTGLVLYSKRLCFQNGVPYAQLSSYADDRRAVQEHA